MNYSLKNFPYWNGGTFDCKNPLKVGEKNNRICRFCGKTAIDGVKFGKDEHSHAISEALGNKSVFCLEECVCCNTKLGHIEQDLIKFLNCFLAIYQIKGKIKPNRLDGLRDVLSPNLKFINENDLLKIESNDIDLTQPISTVHTVLKMNKYKEQNIYKTLCKYVVSLCQPEHKNLFQGTIRWINDDLEERKLPPILFSVIPVIEQPILSYCVRRNNDEALPYVIAELKTVCFSFLYIVPFCGIGYDTCDFDVLFDSFKKIVQILPLSNEYFAVPFNSIELKAMEVDFNLCIKTNEI